MKIEIISIGDELLIGQTVNTNASWIGEQLMNIALRVNWVTTVGDDQDHLKQALHIAENRANAVLLTGGLGPTHDDVTKKVVAGHFNSRLVKNKEVLREVKARFTRRVLDMAKVNEEQALVPDKAEIMKNELGTAPGMIFEENHVFYAVMPGVPQEMKAMMTRDVLPRLKEKAGGQVVQIKILMTTGLPESTLYEKLDVKKIEKYTAIAFLPSLSGVKIRLTSTAQTSKVAQQNIAKAEKTIRDRVGPYIYAENNISLEETIARLLSERRETLAVAESCTGGLVANKLTNVPGSSDFFERGIISYSNRAKISVLGVPGELIEKYGAVSAQVAEAMAEGVRKAAGTDYGISVTGIAGPTGGTVEKPVGLVYIGYADKNGAISEKHNFADDRLGNKQRSAQAVLNLLRKRILNIKG